MANQDVQIRFSLVDGVSKGLAAVEKRSAGVTAALAKIGPAAAVAAAATAALATAGLATVFTAGVQDAANFELALDRIGAKSGVTGEALTALGTQIRDIGQASGKSADESALAFQKLIDEGLSASEAVKTLPTALDFATSSAQKADVAVGGLADTLDAFNLGSDSFARGADVISVGALKAGTSVADMQAQLSQIGPTAGDVKLSLEATAAALGVLAQNGIEGARGSKSLLAILDQLRDPTSKFREELAKIGITSGDFNVVLAQLAQAGPKASAAFNALGVNGTASLKALSKDGGKAVSDLTQELGNVDGATSKTAAAIRDNLLSAWTDATTAFDNARVEFLTPILEPLKVELQELAKQISAFVKTEEFASLRDDFKEAFVEGLAALKKFVKEFDFDVALKSVQTFITDAKALFTGLKENVETIAGAVKLLAEGIKIATNPIGAARSQYEALRDSIDGAGDAATGAAGKLDESGKKIKKVNDSLDQTGEKGKKAGAGLKETGDGADKAGLGLNKLGAVIPIVTGAQVAAEEKTRIINETLKVQQQVAKQTGTDLDDLAGKINYLGGQYALLSKETDLAAQNDVINKKIRDDAKAAAAEIAEGIQADIDARKEQAGALNEVSAAADDTAASLSAIGDVAGAVSSVGAAVNELTAQLDGTRRSSAEATDEVSGLVTTIANTAQQIALLTNTKPEQVLDGLARSANGAIDPILEMSNQIRRAQQRIEELGGQKALEKVRADAQAAADAFANMEENAAKARDAIAALEVQEQNEADQRAGNQEAIENRQFEEKLKHIDELARTSGRSSEAELARVRELTRKNHEARLTEIRDEAAARVNSEIGADSQIASSRGGQSTGPSSSGGLAARNTQPAPSGLNPPPVFNVTINSSALTGEIGLEAVARLIGPVIERIKRRSL